MSLPYATEQQRAATLQVAKAVAGIPLHTAGEAEDAALFAAAPVDDGGAYRHAAYYTAVASRLLGDRSLGISAGQYAVYAAPYVTVTPLTSAMVPTMLVASRAIAIAASQSRDARAVGEAHRVAGWLVTKASPAALELARKDDDSLVGMLRRFEEGMESWGKIAAFAAVGFGALASAGAVWIALKIYEKIKGNR